MKIIKLIGSTFVLLLSTQFLFAQNQNIDVDLISSYEDYTEMDRELVYLHLNKSMYIKGESIGVKAYVLDKNSKKLASQAANLYCTISDESGKTIESKLLMVNNGIAIGDFELGDTYTSGQYTIKAYTNWMRNFNEQNLYVETIRIIDPVKEKQISSNVQPINIDAQFLPEGGHLLVDTENIIGVVIKNEKGLGIADIEGEIVDQNNIVVTNFKLNQFGIGKCLLTPIIGSTYKARFMHNDTEQSVEIKDIESQGIVMSITSIRDKVAVAIKTNSSTLPNIKNSVYKLVVHNGKDLKEIPFKFSDQPDVMKVIANQDLFTGLNIFTVFDANNNPLLERLYFNYEGLNLKVSEAEKVNTSNDTISITLPYSIENSNSLNSFSVSVLPKNTNSFNHQNIVSQLFLQPYIKGYIEQARYYFTEISTKKQFELDNLLITQGWSSYDWNTIFNNPPEYDYDYENGISYTVNSNDKGSKQYMIYPTLNQSTKFINLTKDNASYTAAGLFPIDDESIRIREISSGKVSKPNLYMQFDPIKIPNVDSSVKPLHIFPFLNKPPYFDESSLDIVRKIEQLDEVVINKKKDYTKIEKLQNRSLGRVEAIDEAIVKRYRTLVRYLRDKGFTVADTPTKFEIYTNSVNSTRHRVAINLATTDDVTAALYDPNGAALHLSDNPELMEHSSFDQESSTIPIVYLDGIILQSDLTLLRDLTMDQIEYVEVNKSGASGGMRSGGAGLIRIKTRPTANFNVDSKEVYESFEIPLKFSVAKKFYIPEYKSYDTDFFKEFGVIDWIPNLNLNEDGNLEFKILNKNLKEFKIVVEGVFDNGLISEIKTIKLN